MHRRNFLTRLTLSCLFGYEAVGVAQTAVREPALSLEDVVKLAHLSVPDEIVITKIKKQGKPFDLNSDELRDLKKAGVSDEVVKYLLDPTLPYTAPAPPVSVAKADAPGKKYPPDVNASRIPADSGLYFFSAPKASPVKVELKLLLCQQQPKKLMKKGKTVGYLIAPSAKARVQNSAQHFYVRLPEGKEIEELVLVNLLDKGGRRELDMKPDDIEPRESLEVGSHLFRLTPQKLRPGEYAFFFVGSADQAKGVYGKAYDFGVDAAGVSKPTR